MSFSDRAAKAIAKPNLVKATKATVQGFFRNRLAAYAALGNEQVADLKKRARAARQQGVANLDANVSQFAEQLTRRGARVHFAKTGDEAAARVAQIAKESGGSRIVKSKSMLTEEIHLNHALEAAGLHVRETDLGEYIIQLSGDPPAHIVGPAIGKDRYEIAGLFSKEEGKPVDHDPQNLLQYARRKLRQEFLTADVGVTGCNIAVAETGTIVLVTNEGNANLVTSQPRIQVVVVGMEKVVPTFADVEPVLALLPRACTGQLISSYVAFISGPRLPDEVDGPEELHVIIVDNGRSAIRNTEFEEALLCIRCGSCLNVCPVYRQVGGAAYGDAYSGPIGAVITPLLRGLEKWPDLPHACSLCGSCHEACPMGIHLNDLLLKLRQKEQRDGLVPAGERWIFQLWSWAWASPDRYRLTSRIVRWQQLPFSRSGWMRWAPGPVKGWTDYRDLPVVKAETFRDRWAKRQQERGESLEG
ncbi:MAG TPA: LutB/LldF family L-lactate oxidation iron-sulfur protein [Symbiobacteriaceae bacterium]|nr:LutB/LldF family L-lactate oxidation iron-sulfur protein [Symbiobacteriaceae bacterium]